MNKQIKEGEINIHGKVYKTVALRVSEFYGEDGDGDNLGIITEIISRDETQVCMKASIVDRAGVVLATGHAEEFRRDGMINKTSALENAETSAIGRALAAFGYGGSEFASANEVQGAVAQQGQKIAPEKIATVKAYLENGLIQIHHLEQRFGHARIENLLDVEADRIILGISKAQQQKEESEQYEGEM